MCTCTSLDVSHDCLCCLRATAQPRGRAPISNMGFRAGLKQQWGSKHSGLRACPTTDTCHFNPLIKIRPWPSWSGWSRCITTLKKNKNSTACSQNRVFPTKHRIVYNWAKLQACLPQGQGTPTPPPPPDWANLTFAQWGLAWILLPVFFNQWRS